MDSSSCAEPIPTSEILSCNRDSENLLEFDECIKFCRGISPFRSNFLSFYRQMSMQLTSLLKQLTNKDFINQYKFILGYENITYTGKPYKQEYYSTKPALIGFFSNGEPNYYLMPTMTIDKTAYNGRYFKIHKDGYAYGKLIVHTTIGDFDKTHCYIRWKSNLSDYEYIEPDDELDLNPDDITFELCEDVSVDIVDELFYEYDKVINGNTLENFIQFINDERHYPKKRNKKREKKNNDFPCEISESCEYPDVIFSLYFEQKKNNKLKKSVIDEFAAFQSHWESEHDYGIHTIIDADEIDISCDKDAVNVFVDFGNCTPEIIEDVLDWLKHSKLKIKKMIVR